MAKNNISVYTYPQGSTVARITAVTRPGPECSDKNGNVFVDDSGYGGTDKTYEFAHGGTTPINSFNALAFCAVDPTTNNLAVVLGNRSRSSRTNRERRPSTPIRVCKGPFTLAPTTRAAACS